MEKVQGPPSIMTTEPAPPYPGPPPAGVFLGVPDQSAIQPGPQPAYHYIPQQPHVIQPVNQVVVVQQLPTDAPGQMVCPHCQTTVVTTVKHKNGMLTWLICAVLGVFLCWPCCFIPFCVDACKDVEHSCPSCNTVLHIHKQL